MRRFTFLLLIVVFHQTVYAQTEFLLENDDVKLLETTSEDGDKIYNYFSREMMHDDMFHVLTVSSGSIQDFYNDLLLLNKMCKMHKGSVDERNGRKIASRDEHSVFVTIQEEEGFTIIDHHGLHKVIKALEKRAEERRISLESNTKEMASL